MRRRCKSGHPCRKEVRQGWLRRTQPRSVCKTLQQTRSPSSSLSGHLLISARPSLRCRRQSHHPQNIQDSLQAPSRAGPRGVLRVAVLQGARGTQQPRLGHHWLSRGNLLAESKRYRGVRGRMPTTTTTHQRALTTQPRLKPQENLHADNQLVLAGVHHGRTTCPALPAQVGDCAMCYACFGCVRGMTTSMGKGRA